VPARRPGGRLPRAAVPVAPSPCRCDGRAVRRNGGRLRTNGRAQQAPVSKGEATRGAILDEAGRLARRVGLGGLTIGSLATQTGMSKSGLFAHFGSKESLQIQVLEHSKDRIIDEV